MKKISLIAVLLFFTGCASLPEYDDNNKALVYGLISHYGKNHPSYDGVSLNGVHKYGIEITLVNKDNQKKIKLITNRDGFYYSTAIISGKYKITKIFIKQKDIRETFSSLVITPFNLKEFDIKDKNINNLGFIKLETDGEDIVNIKYINSLQSFQYFRENFADSGWNKNKINTIDIFKDFR